MALFFDGSSRPDPTLPGGAVQHLGAGWHEQAAARLCGSGWMPGAGEASRFLRQAEATGMSLEHLYGWVDSSGQLGQVVLIVPQIGRIGVVMVSSPGRREVGELGAVLDGAVGAVDPSRLTMLQSMLEPRDRHGAAAMKEAGFFHLADLEYRQRAIPVTPPRPELPASMKMISYSQTEIERWTQAMEATYEQTLDCPALSGIRATEDVLAGHRAIGAFDPRYWSLIYEDDRMIGVMLLNPLPAQNAMELVYLGLIPEARGRGLGERLMNYAMWQSRVAGWDAMLLAVDRANEPAMRLYQSMGFRRIGVKSAWIKRLMK